MLSLIVCAREPFVLLRGAACLKSQTCLVRCERGPLAVFSCPTHRRCFQFRGCSCKGGASTGIAFCRPYVEACLDLMKCCEGFRQPIFHEVLSDSVSIPFLLPPGRGELHDGRTACQHPNRSLSAYRGSEEARGQISVPQARCPKSLHLHRQPAALPYIGYGIQELWLQAV